MQSPMGHFRANDGQFNDLMRMIHADFCKLTMATRTSIGQQGHRCGQLQAPVDGQHGQAWLQAYVARQLSSVVGVLLRGDQSTAFDWSERSSG